MLKALKNGLAALALGAVTVGALAAAPAAARDRHDRHDRHDHRYDRHDRHDRYDRRDYRGYRDRGRDRVVVVRDRRPSRVIYAYDWNRPDPRYRGYYADHYYRGGYAPIMVDRRTRIYRGYDDRYYCRRSDGTTGLIIGAALGGVIGDSMDRGRSSVLGALLGAGAGAAIGHEIDSGRVVCR